MRYAAKNKDKVRERYNKWYLFNKNKRKEYCKKYHKKYFNKRRKSDSLFKLRCKISHSIRNSMRNIGYKKNEKCSIILGCSFEFFKEHIESKFTEGMSWSNHGEWEYDHIIPISSAKNELEIISLNHYSNFQPLWKQDNRKKGAKIII